MLTYPQLARFLLVLMRRHWQTFGYHHLSAGDLLREERGKGWERLLHQLLMRCHVYMIEVSMCIFSQGKVSIYRTTVHN